MGKKKVESTPNAVEATLVECEKSIADNINESSGCVDDNGTIILEKSGDANTVKFTRDEMIKIKGTSITHNHPGGSSFSPADIEFACSTRAKQIRVTSNSGRTFKLSMAGGGTFGPKMWSHTIRKVYDKTVIDVKAHYKNEIDNGNISFPLAETIYLNDVWKKVAEALPQFKYEVVIND